MSLHQFFRILRARWLLILVTMLTIIGATIAASLLLPKRYTATATVVVDFKGIDPISGGLLPLLPITGAMATQVDIIQSLSVARRAVDLLKLADNPAAQQLYLEGAEGKGNIRDYLAELLQRHLKVEPARESSVINVSYSGNDPRFSAAVANAIVQSYMQTNLELKTGPAKQTNTFFNEQIKTLKDNVERSQASLSRYQREKGIIATDERLDVENNRLNDLSSQYVAAQSQTFDAQTRERQAQAAIARGEAPETAPDVVANPVVQQLKANITALESKLADLSNRVGKNHPSYLSATAELNGVRAKLKSEMGTVAKTVGNNSAIAKTRENQIKATLDAQRAKVLEMKRVRDDLAVMVRESENVQRAYDNAMARMSQTKLESQTTQTNVSVINEAIEPIEPSSPKILLNAILSILFGAVLAVGVALLREMTDRIVRTETDLCEALEVPVIGVLRRDRRRPAWRRPPAGRLIESA